MIRKGMLMGCVAALLAAAGSGCCTNPGYGGCGIGPCGSGPCAGRLGGIVRNTMTCNSGCGEVYVDEWISDPPACCDPCDSCSGQYIGPQSCCGRPFAGLLNFIVGYRYNGGCADCCGTCGGCDSCGGVSGHGYSGSPGCQSCGHPMQGEVIQSDEYIQPQPTPPRNPPQPTPAGNVSTPRRFDRPYYHRATAARPAVHQTPQNARPIR